MKVFENARSWLNEVITRSDTISNIADEIDSSGSISRAKGSNGFDELFDLSFPSGSARLETAVDEIVLIETGLSIGPTGAGCLKLKSGREYELTSRETLILAEAAINRSNELIKRSAPAGLKV